MTTNDASHGQLILSGTVDDAVRAEALHESAASWRDQRRVAELFDVEVRTLRYHLRAAYAAGELAQETTIRRIWRIQREENPESRS